jgi:hypothetical protein
LPGQGRGQVVAKFILFLAVLVLQTEGEALPWTPSPPISMDQRVNGLNGNAGGNKIHIFPTSTRENALCSDCFYVIN